MTGRCAGWGRRTGRGAAFGVLAAGAVAVMIVAAFGGDASDDIVITGELLGTTPIIPLGAPVGALLPGDRWKRVEIKAKP